MRHVLALLVGVALAATPPKEAVALDDDGIRNEYTAVDVAKVTQGQGPQVAPIGQVEAKWERMETKAKAMKEATDKLAAGLRVVDSLSSKKRKADQEYAKQAHLYAHRGGHPTDHNKDAKMPLDLEVAAAQKNVMDLRFNRAQAQATLLKRAAVDAGAISGAAAAKAEKPSPLSVKKEQEESTKAQAKEKQALGEYRKFKQETVKTKLLEKKLQSKKAVQRALSRSAAGAENAKLRDQRLKLQTAAVEAQTAQTGVEVEKEQASVLVFKKLAQDTKHEQQVAGLKEQLSKSKAATKAETKRADEATAALKSMKQDSSEEKELKHELSSVKP